MNDFINYSNILKDNEFEFAQIQSTPRNHYNDFVVKHHQVHLHLLMLDLIGLN